MADNNTAPAQKVKRVKPLPPYWAELGYELDPQTGLFHRVYQKMDGTMAHEVSVEASQFHRIRKHNLKVMLDHDKSEYTPAFDTELARLLEKNG